MIPAERLNEIFRWVPGNPGDPGPEVYQLFHVLDFKSQLQVVGTLLQARVTIAETTAEAYKQLGNIVRAVKT